MCVCWVCVQPSSLWKPNSRSNLYSQIVYVSQTVVLSRISYLLCPDHHQQQQETVEALRAAGYERAAVIGELLGLEEGAAGEGGQSSLIELVVSPKA